jgi:hypothetical protein
LCDRDVVDDRLSRLDDERWSDEVELVVAIARRRQRGGEEPGSGGGVKDAHGDRVACLTTLSTGSFFGSSPSGDAFDDVTNGQ